MSVVCHIMRIMCICLCFQLQVRLPTHTMTDTCPGLKSLRHAFVLVSLCLAPAGCLLSVSPSCFLASASIGLSFPSRSYVCSSPCLSPSRSIPCPCLFPSLSLSLSFCLSLSLSPDLSLSLSFSLHLGPPSSLSLALFFPPSPPYINIQLLLLFYLSL